jgi:pre-rRNA-processing protein IPI1
VLEWLLNTAGNEVVTCPGGWPKTLKCFAGLLGWDSTETTLANGIRASTVKASGGGTWTSTPATSGKSTNDIKILTKTLTVLSLFLECGLLPTLAEKQAMALQSESSRRNFPLWDTDQHLLPKVSNPYGHLNLFGAPRDEEGMEYEDRADRIRYFNERWKETFKHGTERVKREGGGIGRVAVGVERLLDAR